MSLLRIVLTEDEEIITIIIQNQFGAEYCQITSLLPVVILTSSDEEHDRLKIYEIGANSFVRKPVDFAEFAETVARLDVYWLATNEPPPWQ
jgi:CheY-like chemotaxis protein